MSVSILSFTSEELLYPTEKGWGRLYLIIRRKDNTVLWRLSGEAVDTATPAPLEVVEALPKNFLTNRWKTIRVRGDKIPFVWQCSFSTEKERCEAAVEEYISRCKGHLLPVFIQDKNGWVTINPAEITEHCPDDVRSGIVKYSPFHLFTQEHIIHLFKITDIKLFTTILERQLAIEALKELGR